MKVSSVVSAVLGSFVVYGLVAACGSSASDPDGISIRGMADAMVNVLEGGDSTPVAHAGGDSGGGTTTVTDPTGYVSGTRLKVKRLVSADGASEPQGFYDSQRQEACDFRAASDGATRCQPNGTYASYFADSGCTVVAALIPPGCSTAPKYLQTYTSTCVTEFNLYPASPPTPIATTTVYSGTRASCTKGDYTNPVYAGYTVAAASGAAIDPTSFASATLTTDP